jgi:Protein of unknown function (DUF1524)
MPSYAKAMKPPTRITLVLVAMVGLSLTPIILALAASETPATTTNECTKPYYRAAFGSSSPKASVSKKSIAIWKSVDFYTGSPVVGPIDIDHIFSLSESWPASCAWPKEKRVSFANSQFNLRPTSARENRRKGDASPATWSPTNRDRSCSYGTLYMAVAAEWDLPLSAMDIQAVHSACGVDE